MTDTEATAQENRFDAWLVLTGKMPAPAGPVELSMLSGSMAPAIPIGALLRSVAGPHRACRVGDVAIFLVDDKLIAHRILLVLRAGPWDWVLEKGDTNHLGRWRRGASVRGRVVGFVVGEQPPQGDPTDAGLASSGLRRHIRHWLLTLGGRRGPATNE